MKCAKYFYMVAGAGIVMSIVEAVLDFPWYMDTLGWLALFISNFLAADLLSNAKPEEAPYLQS